MSKLYIILGNGFSIDTIEKINKVEEIDLFNLFKKGAYVRWPKNNGSSFLSYKHCKSLWTLGARTTLNNKEANDLIENIITCSNVYLLAKENMLGKGIMPNNDNNSIDNIYISAYGELTTYLRYLMIYYNKKIQDEELKNANIPLIKYINDNYKKYSEIVIITYNYDILLERLLEVNNLYFNIECFENNNSKIKIYKPHGSISFSYTRKFDEFEDFNIAYSEINNLGDLEINQFNLKYSFDEDFPKYNAIIPPAGDADRFNMAWAKVVRKELLDSISKSEEGDEVIIFGMSYWHVDRMEIDEIITNLNSNVDIRYINPYPNKTLDSVLTSLFKNYIHIENSGLLEVD
ncbi:hypothetical protein I2900191A2_21760 [Intestinibacter bartlettii]|uniref:hypothetical protein n=1 Tax=Intestinibacter bartlettii TaxID=261299 RepID=UPI0034B8153F